MCNENRCRSSSEALKSTRQNDRDEALDHFSLPIQRQKMWNHREPCGELLTGSTVLVELDFWADISFVTHLIVIVNPQATKIPAPRKTPSHAPGAPVLASRGQHPVVDVTGRRVAPHDVADAVVVEVADADRDRTCGMRADIEAARPLAVLDQPDVDVVGRRIVPGDVAGAVALKSAAPSGCQPAGCGPTSTLPAHWPFEIFQMSTSPVVGLYQAMSLVPSPLKSPASAGW